VSKVDTISVSKVQGSRTLTREHETVRFLQFVTNFWLHSSIENYLLDFLDYSLQLLAIFIERPIDTINFYSSIESYLL